MFNNDFSRGSDTPMKMNVIVFGIKGPAPVNRDGIGRFDVSSLGALQYDTTFDLSSPATQQFIFDTCVELETATELVNDKAVSLVRQSAGLGRREINCFIRSFRDWHAESDYCEPCTARLKQLSQNNALSLEITRLCHSVCHFLFSLASEGWPVPASVFYSRLSTWIELRYNMSHASTRPMRFMPDQDHGDMVFVSGGRAKYVCRRLLTIL